MLCARLVLLLVAAVLPVACGAVRAPFSSGPGEARDWAPDPEAERTVRESLAQSQGVDALEAWEMNGLSQSFRFAIARKWTGERVKVLAYVLSPDLLRGAAYVGHLRPHALVETWFREPEANGGPDDGRVRRGRGRGGPAAVVIAGEVVLPTLPENYAFRRLPDQILEGDACSVIEGRLLHERRRRGFDRVVFWISQQNGVTRRKVYYRAGRELRRVSVAERDVREMDGRPFAVRRVVRLDDGTLAELVLHNAVLDVELPDRLFTEQTLRLRRFPRF